MEKIVQKLRRSRERMPEYREVLDLAERILTEKRRSKEGKKDIPFQPDPAKAKIHLEGGFPYLRPAEAFPLSPQAEESFSRLLKALQEVSPARHQSLKKAIETGGFSLRPALERLLQNRLSEANLEKELGPEGGLLFFFLVQVVKPAFEFQAEQWRAGLKELPWDQGYCPFCGGFAGMGEIKEEGRRFLHCLLCGTEWEYPRMKCPYCQNQEQERLTYFQVEGEEGSRVDVCLACRHYWKTVDSREIGGRPDFEIEDYLTLHLDHLAQEEGYLRPPTLFVDVR